MLIQHPMDVLKHFEVRKTRKQKAAFRSAVRAYAESMRYAYTEEQCSLGGKNLVMGDPKRANYLVTAHYDTCAVLPFPNFLTPCNLWLFVLFQLAVCVVICAPVFLVAGAVGYWTHDPMWGSLSGYAMIFLLLALMLGGKANKHTANDNTSGTVTVLELMEKLPAELREQVCFVLFDLEEAGLFGSSSYRKTHKEECGRQVVLNLDCVGDGVHMLLFPRKAVKKDKALLERLKSACPQTGETQFTVIEKGFAVYPSDQMNFPLGVGIAAFRKKKGIGYYMGRIHTKRDTVLEEGNVATLRNYVISFLQEERK